MQQSNRNGNFGFNETYCNFGRLPAKLIMKQESDILKTLVGSDLKKDNQVILKSIDYYKKVSEIINRTDKALGRKKEYMETTQSTIDLKISPNAVGSTTNF